MLRACEDEGMNTHVPQHLDGGQKQFANGIFSFCHVGSGSETQVVKLVASAISLVHKTTF